MQTHGMIKTLQFPATDRGGILLLGARNHMDGALRITGGYFVKISLVPYFGGVGNYLYCVLCEMACFTYYVRYLSSCIICNTSHVVQETSHLV